MLFLKGRMLSSVLLHQHWAAWRQVPAGANAVSWLPCAEVRRLAREVLALEEGLPRDALDAGGAAWPYEARQRWRALLEATTRPPEARALPLPLCHIAGMHDQVLMRAGLQMESK
jgi:hypothetical protein